MTVVLHFFALSIENARRKKEYDKLMKEVEEIKTMKREQIKALRNEFWKLLAMNKELPVHLQFQRKVSVNDWLLFEYVILGLVLLFC